jgi:hypothetical protein
MQIFYLVISIKYDKQDPQGKAAFNELNKYSNDITTCLVQELAF